VIILNGDLLTIIKKHALKNAIEHEGKALVNPVVASVIGEKPELKRRIKEILKKVEEIVNDVNKLSLEEQRKQLEEIAPEILKVKKIAKEFELPPLPNAEDYKVVTAFPPEPSKYPHIGHAKGALLNYLYAKKYKGKFILRMEDTNPTLAKKEYYEAITDGLKWLGIEWDKLEYISDNLEKFYEATEELIKNNKAYVCTCKQSEIRKNRKLMKECGCRKNSKRTNLTLWKDMLTTLKEGEALVRLKISMKHKNAAMRDPAIMRIVDYPHPRVGKKYRVWPLYDFGTALMDAWEGVTHRIRSKEFEIRKELQQYIQKLFGFKPPFILEIGRLNLEGVLSSGRVIREMIKSGKLSGWDDPRLTTLVALKRRGFTPEGIKNFLLRTGISKADAIISWDILYAENRKVIDPLANRYFAVINPVRISVRNAPQIKETEASLHPDFPERGKKKLPVDVEKIYVEREDFEKFENNEVGLMNLFSIRLKKEAEFISKEIKFEVQKIHWVSEPNVKVKIVMPNGEIKEALAEPEIRNVKINQLIQLQRVGFCRVDSLEPLVLYFTHK
jgi:glutamyl-tRNA synthetase